MIVALSGKGGVGKTTLLAVLLDELARRNYPGRMLAVDADPAMTLHLALGLPEPTATVAQVREAVELDAKTIRSLPPGTTPADYLLERLQAAGYWPPAGCVKKSSICWRWVRGRGRAATAGSTPR